ncbi:MAG: SDR family oxidoreductase [Phycisphaerae bacterium]
MKNCLVTGGAGFVGGHVVRGLLQRGQNVRVLDNLSTGKAQNLDDVRSDIEFIAGDICDPQTCADAMKGIDTVFHLAARASVPRSIEFPVETNQANVTGTINLLLAARDEGCSRFVYSASSSAYGDTPTLPKIETMTPNPLSPYAVSKLAAEHYCHAFANVYGMQTISLRYFNVFGPRQDPNSAYAAVIPAFVTRMVRGEQPVIYGDGEQTRDFCFVDNVVAANLQAATTEGVSGEVVNIGCGERTSLNSIVHEINRHLGTRLAPMYQPGRPGDVRDSLASIDAAKRIIGYTPQVFFAEGLERSIAWYREHAEKAEATSAR